MNMRNEIQKELIDAIIPFWEALRDDEYGGFYGYMDYDLNLDKKAEKGCILNSRITWFFASAYKALKDPKLLDEAAHGYEFLKEYCIDREYRRNILVHELRWFTQRYDKTHIQSGI